MARKTAHRAGVCRSQAAGTRVLRVEPSQEDLDVMGFNFTDHRRRAATLESALTTTHL